MLPVSSAERGTAGKAWSQGLEFGFRFVNIDMATDIPGAFVLTIITIEYEAS